MSDAIGGEEDEAVQAFEALRAEVANLRRGIELVYQQGQEARSVDYSLTLGEMAQTLQGLQGRLAAIEGKPALAVTPAVYREQIAAAARLAAEVAGRALGEGTAAQRAATRALREVTSHVREAHEQQRSLVMAGAIGVLGGVFLWFMSVALLPLGAGDWLAALPLGGGPWRAGEALMQRDSPAAFDRMARLYQACGGQATELCEAAITARAIQAGQEGGKAAPALAPSHPLPRGGRAGQQGQ
jgi:hypothetical protein